MNEFVSLASSPAGRASSSQNRAGEDASDTVTANFFTSSEASTGVAETIVIESEIMIGRKKGIAG